MISIRDLQISTFLLYTNGVYEVGESFEYTITTVCFNGKTAIYDLRFPEIKNENGDIIATVEYSEESDYGIMPAYYFDGINIADHWVFSYRTTTRSVTFRNVLGALSYDVIVGALSSVVGWWFSPTMAMITAFTDHAPNSRVIKIRDAVFANSRVLSDFAYLGEGLDEYGNFVTVTGYDYRLLY